MELILKWGQSNKRTSYIRTKVNGRNNRIYDLANPTKIW